MFFTKGKNMFFTKGKPRQGMAWLYLLCYFYYKLKPIFVHFGNNLLIHSFSNAVGNNGIDVAFGA